MMFKNSIKLLMSNFSSVWKLLLYKTIVIAIVTGLFCATLSYLNSLTNITQLTNNILTFLTSCNFSTTPIEILSNLFNVFQTIYFVSLEMISTMPLIFAYLLILLFVILPFLWHLSDVGISETLYGYMSSQTKYGFSGAMVRKVNTASLYSLLFTFLILPFNALFLFGFINILYLSSVGGILLYFLPFLLIMFSILYFSLRTTFLSGWIPAIIVYNCNPAKGFKKGLKALLRRFFRVWSTSIVIILAFMGFISFFGSFGVVLALPVTCLLISIFGMVMFFESQGMRYYVDMDTILTPKKLEETDKINKLKNIV
ncbi:MAG: hypothetical protein PHQ62_01280 [Clostridia bacterium]|nr:hypothetical protein [Clostridia bacterium]